MNADGALFLLMIFLFVMNFVLIVSFRRIQTSFLKRRNEALEALGRMAGPHEQTLSWANVSGLPLVVGSMLMFDLFFLIFALTLVDSDIPDNMFGSLSASIIFGFFIPISLGTWYTRVNLRHLYVYDRNGIQGFIVRRNGPMKGIYLEWRGISRLKFIRTYRVPSPIGIRLNGDNGGIVLPNYLENYPMVLSHLMRFASDEIRSAILSEFGDIIDNDGNISFSDE